MALTDYMGTLQKFGYNDPNSAISAARQKYGYAPTVTDQQVTDMLESQARSYERSGGSGDYQGFFSNAAVTPSLMQKAYPGQQGVDWNWNHDPVTNTATQQAITNPSTWQVYNGQNEAPVQQNAGQFAFGGQAIGQTAADHDMAQMAGPTKGFGSLPTQPQGGQPQNPYMPQPFSVGGGAASSTPPAPSGGGWPGGGGGPVGFDNPYLAAQANAMTDQVSRRFNQQIAPSIRRNAVATGGFGGSRQGIAEGMAAQGAQDALAGGLANLYSSGYQADRGYDLGMGGLYNQGRSLDMQQARLGGDLFTQGLNNAIGVGNALYTSGQQEQMAPWQNSINPYLNAISLLAGNSGTTSTGGQTGGGLGGALGGGIAGAQLYKMLFGG